MIKVENLTRHYGSTRALSNLSFQVAEGSVVGFLGPNGAGKSTTMKILTGSVAPTSGSASVRGHDVISEPLAVRRLVGFMPENVALYQDDTVMDFLKFVSDLKNIPKEKISEHLDQIIHSCGLDIVRHKMVGNLSHGFTKRVGLAQALVGDPPVLILDEPTSGLDPKQIVGIRELIRSFRGKRTVLISSHILSEISATCDRVLILNQGKLVGEDTPDALHGGSSFSSSGQRVVLVWSGSHEKVCESLLEVDGVDTVDATGDGAEVLISGDPATVRPLLVEKVLQGRGKLQTIQDKGPSLEDLFLRLTGPVQARQDSLANAVSEEDLEENS
ncbi:MAG: ABC transporter ATP-binding protein [bacterium]|nr:ABC transporter ATP-binding protein [bacterium]